MGSNSWGESRAAPGPFDVLAAQVNADTVHQQQAEITRLRGALEWLRENWHPTHQHWDAQGTSGRNCRQCANDSAARQMIREALQ